MGAGLLAILVAAIAIASSLRREDERPETAIRSGISGIHEQLSWQSTPFICKRSCWNCEQYSCGFNRKTELQNSEFSKRRQYEFIKE